MEQDPVNPHLADIFSTLLKQGQATPPGPPERQVVVGGGGNVFVFGGNIYLSTNTDDKEAKQ